MMVGSIFFEGAKLHFPLEDPDTIPETNIFAPEIYCLEDEFPFGSRPIFRGYVKLQGV